MKKLYALFLSCLFYSFANSQSYKFTADYALGLPEQEMAQNIQAIHGLHLGGLYRLPNQLKNMSVGLELGFGVYSHKTIDQTFNFDANTTTVVPVNYNSNVFNASVQTRYHLLNESRNMIVPYINAKAGLYNFYSNVVVEDPSDPDGCHPLDKKNLINDNTFYWGAGVGFQINPALLTKHKKQGPVRIDISINTLYGGNLDYINTKHLKDEPDMPVAAGGKPLYVRFMNVGTQDIHEHKVAQVYNTALRILEIRGGLVVNIGK